MPGFSFPALMIGGTPRREKPGRIVQEQDTSPGQGHTTEGVHMSERPMTHKGEYALTPGQWRTIAAHEQVYREIAEQQAETRDARRRRAMNRPRGRTGTYEDTE